ncbi:MAG: S8 family serine peptidase [Lachnospiraceae bacterium]|nr:S8 family serine peptidase [Lachnospiraceae bacterium]
MTDQKAENVLNLALSTPEAERVQTDDLNVGFDPKFKTWEVIVTYSGDLRRQLQKQFPDVQMQELYGGFAILEIPEQLVEAVIKLEEIEYMEKPKRLYFALNQARTASCFLPVQSTGSMQLSGRGVLIGIIDSGMDYFHKDFRNEDGSSRILFLYDQVADQIITKEEIDKVLELENREMAEQILSSIDVSGHGTAVAGIAAGNGRESNGKYRGVAYDSDLIVVRLGIADTDGFPRTTQVMKALDFVVHKAVELGMPIAVNLSFGNSYGSHDGNGLFERYIDQLTEVGRSVFVIGTGNEGDKAGHTNGRLQIRENQIVELSVAPYETGFSVQIWKHYPDEFDIFLTDPSGTNTHQIKRQPGTSEFKINETRILQYYGEPSPFSEAQEIYFEFIPMKDYIENGIWKFTLQPIKIVDGRYDFWLPTAGALNRSTRFLRPVPDTTITIPSTTFRPIAVGAYDDDKGVYAPFSGRGNTRDYRIPKPDLVAPGVGIVAPKRGGGYEPVTGTSFAAPFVTGASALMMEWGIVQGNDPYLYGDKVKAYLRKGAKPILGEIEYPNPRVGYGALCVKDSIPR